MSCRVGTKRIKGLLIKGEIVDLKRRTKQLKQDIPALYLALKDRKTPIIAKLLAGIIVVYALSPIDLIPDFIPVLGYLDDLVVKSFK